MSGILNARSLTFIEAVRGLGAACDGEIEHTAFSGGGIRFTGFCRLSLRRLGNVLRAFGKRAAYKVDAVNPECLYVDCYDNIDPVPPQLQSVSDIRPALTKTQQEYTFGAVGYSPYQCDRITSESIESILLDTSILDVTLMHGILCILKVSPESVNVVGGLATQIQTNPKMRFAAEKPLLSGTRGVRFKNGGPRIRKCKKPKKKKGWLASLF